jgi:hypothetical protein
MLNRERLILAIDIQSRSYRLLRWIGTALDKGLMPIGRAQQHSNTPEAAIAWIGENFQLLPQEVQPDRTQVREFASFFWTYVTTSFDVVGEPATRLEPGHCGCECPLCARIKNASHLQPKKLTKSDKRRAIKLMGDRVAALAQEEGIVADRERVHNIVTDSDTRRAAGFSTYGFWLINRLSGSTDGPSILALWREIAWNRKGSPIQGFKMRYEDFELAEESLIQALRNASEQSDTPEPGRRTF